MSSLHECHAGLMQFMQRKKTQCLWFYFLAPEDILQLVCYGMNMYMCMYVCMYMYTYTGRLRGKFQYTHPHTL